MNAFFRLLLVAAATFILWMVTTHSLTAYTTTRKLAGALQSDRILIGDSHAQNLPWPQDQSAFILPGAGLFHVYLVVKQLTSLKSAGQANPTLVVPIWPGTFNRDQENRYTGDFRDSWGAAIGGRTCNYWSLKDWSNPRIPLYLKTKALLGKIQINRTNTQQDGNSCNPEIRTNPERLIVNHSPYPENWISDANLSWWFFEEINAMVMDAGMKVVWVSTPTHPNFLNAVDGIEEYQKRTRSRNPQILHFDALEFNSDDDGFLDYHHINCNIAVPLVDSLEAYLKSVR